MIITTDSDDDKSSYHCYGNGCEGHDHGEDD